MTTRLIFIIFVFISSSCSQKNQIRNAFESFNEGVKFSLKADSCLIIGDFKNADKFFNKSNEYYLETLKLDSTHNIVPGALAQNYYLMGNFENGKVWYSKAIVIDSTSAFLTKQLGLCEYYLCNFRVANKTIKKSLDLDQSLEFRKMVIQDILDIGSQKFKQGLELENKDKNASRFFKETAMITLLSCYSIDSTNIQTINILSDFADKLDNDRTFRIYKKRIKEIKTGGNII